MTERFDVVVVGLGGLGSATAWQLARRGARVLGLERFALGHVRGASHGDSRIIRLSYHSPGYVANAREAYADWADLAADSGVPQVTRCGGADIFPVGAAIPLADYAEAMTAEGVPFELLDAGTSRRRFPALAVPDGADVLYSERSGYVQPSAATATMQRRAIAHGAVLREHSQVVELVQLVDGPVGRGGPGRVDAGVRVRCADGSTFEAGSAVVTADAWTNQVLAGLDVTLPLTVTKEQVVHFDVRGREATHTAPVMPIWIWMDDPSYYGFPTVGEPTVKVGQDCGGDPIDPDLRDFEPMAGALDRMRAFVQEVIPGAGEVTRVTTCLYTLTPDRDFVAGLVPGHERVTVGLGAAHGFKFAPWFGRVLADLATLGTTSSDLAAMQLDRPALTDPSAPARWLV